MSNHSSRKALDLPLREIAYSENQQQFSFDITLNEMANPSSQHSGSIKSVLIRHKEESNRSKDEVQTKRVGSSKGIANKENKKQVEVQQLSYLHLSRTLEEKCSLIAKQKEEIQVLKQCVQDIRNNKEFKTTEEQRLNNAQILRLKQQEKQYLDNLREIDILKNNIREVRRKYEAMANEKNVTNQKYNKVLKENEELTVVISNLKEEVELRSTCPRNIELQENISQLKQELRKQQMEKQAVEERCCNFEKRMNEYVLKYNELQENCNQYQIKYYRLQKDCDNLRVDKEEAENQRNNANKQLRSERNIHEEEQNKFKSRVKKMEQEKVRLEETIILLKQAERRRYCDNEEIQKLNDQTDKLKSQNCQLRDEISFQTRKWEKYIKEVMKQFGQEREQLKDQHTLALSCKEEENNKLNSELSRLQEKETLIRDQTCREIIYLKQAVEENEQQLKERMNAYESLTSKCSQLADQNMRISKHYKLQLTQLEDKIKSYQNELESANMMMTELQTELEAKNQQQDIIQDKIDELEGQIQQGNDFLKCQTDALKAENDSLHEQLTSASMKQKQAELKLQQLSLQIQRISELFKKKEEELAQNMKQVQAAYQLIKRVRSDEGKQKRYYQQKYENQLQEYNNLSSYYSQIESEHASLLKQHTECVLEISNLKAEVSQQSSKGDWESRIVELCGQVEQLIAKVTQKEAAIKEMDVKVANLILERDHHKVLSERNQQRLKEFDVEIKLHIQRSQEKDRIIARIRSQLEIQVQQIQRLSLNLQQTEIKYQSLSERYNAELANWEIQKQEFEMQWRHYQTANQEERQELQYSRMNFSLSFDNSQTTIDILRRENEELQRIFGCQIERRNSIIRQLISEKKQLYDQLASRTN